MSTWFIPALTVALLAPFGATAAGEDDIRVEPEMLIQFPGGTFACATAEDLARFIGHASRNETTKANAMDVSRGGPCMSIKANYPIKVLSAIYPDNESDVGVIEIVPAKSKEASGLFALTAGAREVRPTKSLPKKRM